MAAISGPPASATRNQPITEELKRVINTAADAAGIDTVRIVSGGQPARGEGTRRTGSPRHDHGRAADIKLVQRGDVLTFTDDDGGPTVEAFITAAAALGANGIGAGLAYMGNDTIHVGFGTSPSDHTELVWGEDGRSVNAPGWLRQAARKGWDNPQTGGIEDVAALRIPGRFVVIARNGLRLRNGPGLEFDATRTLEVETEIRVVGFDGPGGDWARVDLEDDGLIDGHVLAAFLAPAGSDADSHEEAEEPG